MGAFLSSEAPMEKALNSKQIKHLRGLAHKLEPVVMVGQYGMTEGVFKEIEATLEAHELIKIKLRCDDQDELSLLLTTMEERVKATRVQVIGHTAVLFRRSKKEPKVAIPGIPLPPPPLKHHEIAALKKAAAEKEKAKKPAKRSFPTRKKEFAGEQKRKTRLFH